VAALLFFSGENLMNHPYRVVVVEDDPDVAFFTKTVLEKRGFPVTPASTRGSGSLSFPCALPIV